MRALVLLGPVRATSGRKKLAKRANMRPPWTKINTLKKHRGLKQMKSLVPLRRLGILSRAYDFGGVAESSLAVR